jgi:hypothetical protein
MGVDNRHRMHDKVENFIRHLKGKFRAIKVRKGIPDRFWRAWSECMGLYTDSWIYVFHHLESQVPRPSRYLNQGM